MRRDAHARPAAPGLAGLTYRERALIRLTWVGLTRRQQGRLLGMGRPALHHAWRKIYAKLDLHDADDPRLRAAVLLWQHEYGRHRCGNSTSCRSPAAAPAPTRAGPPTWRRSA